MKYLVAVKKTDVMLPADQEAKIFEFDSKEDQQGFIDWLETCECPYLKTKTED